MRTTSRRGVLRCALYARRSTDEHQAASLEVQLEEARRYVASKGWTLDPEHVYVDDAISRAEFKKRPALIRLLNAAEAGAFDVVVTRDETRLGGDMIRTSLLVQELLDRGIQLFFYFSDEEVQLNDATAKFLMAARNFASELEREKVSQRTREHLKTKARRGYNVGGRVYGYKNIEIKHGDARVRVEYVIDPEQAEVVREIFRLYLAGSGLKRIVKELNTRRIASPRAGKRGTGSWSPSVVREMLRNERYRGAIVWGEYAKTYRGGTKVRVRRQADDPEVIRLSAPELQIIDDELWFAVQACFGKRKVEPQKAGAPPRHLLSGLGKCAECGGPIAAVKSKHGAENCTLYMCGWYKTRGEPVCTNSLRRPAAEVNDGLVDWIRANLLTEEFVIELLHEVRARLVERTKSTTTNVVELQEEAASLRREVDRLVAALAITDDKPDAIVAAVADRQARLRAIDAQVRAALAAPDAVSVETRRMEGECRARIEALRAALERNPEEARTFLQTLFPERLVFTPVETPSGKRRYRIEGQAVVGAMLGNVPNGASPGGFEFYNQVLDNLLRNATLARMSLNNLAKRIPLGSALSRPVPPRSASSRHMDGTWDRLVLTNAAAARG